MKIPNNVGRCRRQTRLKKKSNRFFWKWFLMGNLKRFVHAVKLCKSFTSNNQNADSWLKRSITQMKQNNYSKCQNVLKLLKSLNIFRCTNAFLQFRSAGSSSSSADSLLSPLYSSPVTTLGILVMKLLTVLMGTPSVSSWIRVKMSSIYKKEDQKRETIL